MKQRKKIINLIIVGILLVILSINATYAYFKASAINNFGTKSVTGHIEDNGNVSIRTGANLILDIKNADMKDKGVDTTYYASSSGTTTTETYENIGIATAVGSGSNQCTYKIKVEDKSTNSMYTAFQSMESKSEGQIQLIINGAVYDFNTVGLFPLTITGTLRNIKDGESQNITAGLKLVNKTGMNQNALAETDINLSFTVEELTCTSTENDIELNATNLAKYENLWDSGLEDDGYRYVGNSVPYCSYDSKSYGYELNSDGSCPTLYNYTRTTIADGTTIDFKYQTSCPSNSSAYTYSNCTEVTSDEIISTNNPNNYICFGTTDKNECVTNTDAYMYRIIGTFPDNSGKQYMKLIKKESLENEGSGLAWHENFTSDILWKNSDLYKGLNEDYFLSNTTYVPNKEWSDKIVDWTWNTVNTDTYSGGPNYLNITVKNVYLHEMNKNGAMTGGVHNTTTGKIGLMYVSDYLLAVGTIPSLEYENNNKRVFFKKSWMDLSNNDSEAPRRYEWTISRSGFSSDHYSTWHVHYLGTVVGIHSISSPYSVRPVFYLNSDEVIASGKGTLLDPFILK